MKILVLGCGSIGKRHIANLLDLGVEVYAYDKDLDKLENTLKEFNIRTFDFRSHHIQMDAYVICTPTAYHIPFAFEALDHNAHIFIEKPISHNLQRVEELITKCREMNRVLMIGYQLRFNSALQHAKNIIKYGELGKLLSIRSVYGNYLPNWHPDEDYLKLYTGIEVAGGGIVRDASHEIDYVLWIADSSVTATKSMVSKVSDLEINVEDTADILLKFKNGIQANIHIDMVNRLYTRTCSLVFEKDTWDIELKPNNDDYINEMIHFVDCVKGYTQSIISGEDALKILQICMKVLNET